MGTKLQTIQIDPFPANIAAMMERGFFHSHQDGRWRFSPYGGETVYCNDPTERFEARADFGNGVGAAVCQAPALIARIYKDGTRGLDVWEPNILRCWDRYAPSYPEEAVQRAWIIATFEATSRGGYVVGWINPDNLTQAGEYHTRDREQAQSFADEKRARGYEVEVLKAVLP